MIETYTHEGGDFKAVKTFEGWKIAFLRNAEQYSERNQGWARHMLTDEAFVLLQGSAVLLAKAQDGTVERMEMKPCTLYVIPEATWHRVLVTDNDTTVLVVENSNTSKSNTEKVEQ